MVRAYHLILSAYGFWLPNDPRGSWSEFVGAWELWRYGKATTVNVTRSLASDVHNQKLRLQAKKALRYPAVRWNGRQARSIGEGFSTYVRRANLDIMACAIMPDHIHLVTARNEQTIERVSNFLKGAATRRITADRLHPLATQPTVGGRMPKMFARGQWAVFLNHDGDVQRAIQYVNENPIRAGLRPQRWTFVQSC